jgi:hypothetical protein
MKYFTVDGKRCPLNDKQSGNALRDVVAHVWYRCPGDRSETSLQEAVDFPAASAVKVGDGSEYIVETVNGIMSINYEPSKTLSSRAPGNASR